MKNCHLRRSVELSLIVVILILCLQPISSAQQGSVVPTLVNFSGTLTEVNGKPLTRTVGVTFLLYKDQQGGPPLWIETQNVQPDKNGRYTVALGATKREGLPTDLFVSGDARWLAVEAQGQPEQPRVLLLSVPYALKAGDAQTVGGLPASAFVLAVPLSAAPAGQSSPGLNTNLNAPSIGGTGKPNYLPIWTKSTTLGNSVLFQSGAGSKAQVGINTTKPASTLDVNGGGTIRGLFSLPATGTATAKTGFNSQPADFVASAYNSGTNTAVNQTFQLQAEPVGNDTNNATGSLNVLFAPGNGVPKETGLNIASNGLITFAKGQTFPGTGNGTVTSVGLSAPGSDFNVSGSPVTSSGTLGLSWTVAPTSANTANAIVKRDSSGNFSANTISASGLNSGTLSLTNWLSLVGDAYVYSSGGGTTLWGVAAASSGDVAGVEGDTYSTGPNAYGVYGSASASSGTPIGVYGVGAGLGSPGVYGQNGTQSGVAGRFLGLWGPGVWGDGGTVSEQIAVLGTVDDGLPGWFANNSPSGYDGLIIETGNSNSVTLFAYNSSTGQYCDIDSGGNINCSGAKNAVVPIEGGKRTVALAAIESPKNWFEDAGSGQLANGAAVVAIDPTFMQTVNTSLEYQVFLTPYGDCKGLYVTNRTADSFEVHEIGGGAANVSFGYRIMALRKNYENIRFADHTHDLDGHKKMMERLRANRSKVPATPMRQGNSAMVHPASVPTTLK